MKPTRSVFEEQLEELRNGLLEMGSAVDGMLDLAMRALSEVSVSLAERVLMLDDRVDDLDQEIEERCMGLLALQHPVASDLRLVASAMKVITDLERIGDHAVDIAKVARKLAAEDVARPLADLPRMSDCVRKMLRDALRALVSHDLALVDGVVCADDGVDDLFHRIRDDLHQVMRREPDVVIQASWLLFTAHYLERIADHAVNIAERVYFVETGERQGRDR